MRREFAGGRRFAADDNTQMRLFPLFADLAGRAVLVVGGGMVASRKANALLQSGARVCVGAREALPELRTLAQQGRIFLREGDFDPAWLDGMWLVIAATDDREVNRRVSRAAEARRILANVVDDPELSTFQVPSLVDRAPLVVAVSSAGAAPVLARRIRERIESLVDHSMGDLAQLAQQHRADIRRRYPEMGARRQFYDWMFDGPVAALLRAGRKDDAQAVLSDALLRPATMLPGRLILAGAGPGPAALLTLQVLRALNEADLIVHHPDVTQEVLALARRDANLVRQDGAATAPGELLQQLAALVRAGRCVVHLQPGDALQPGAPAALQALLGNEAVWERAAGLPATGAPAAS